MKNKIKYFTEILTEPNMRSLKLDHIIHHPNNAWESTIRKAEVAIKNINNFDASILENTTCKLSVIYKETALDWTGNLAAWESETLELNSIVFPRHLCYDVPLRDLGKFPFAFTIMDGEPDKLYFKNFFPTFRILSSDIILVDLGILGPSPLCPQNKYNEYWDILLQTLYKIRNMEIDPAEPPDICRIYNNAQPGGFSMQETFAMIVCSFMIKNDHQIVGDLCLAIDEMMEQIDKQILKQL